MCNKEKFWGLLAAPVNDVRGALENPLVTAEGRLMDFAHPTRGRLRILANPVRCPGEAMPRRPAPALGEYTDEVLRGRGYEEARIGALRKAKVI